MDLLKHRAEQPTWPELAEYACYACHHSLAGPNGWRAELKSKGLLPWSSWPLAALKAMAPDDSTKFDEFAAHLGSRPDGKSVAQKADALKPLIGAVAKKFEKNAEYVALRNSVARSLKTAARDDWDSAAQLYLAMAALSPEVDRAKLAEFWNELRQPGGFSAKREQYLQKLDALLDFAGAK